MSIQSILLPVFVQVALIFAICFRMIYAHHSGGGAEAGKLLSDSFSNQFEMPVLYFALVPLALLLHQAGYLFVILSWIFVASRIVHMVIHTTTNKQPARGLAWLVGVITLFVMWIAFAIAVLFPRVLLPA